MDLLLLLLTSTTLLYCWGPVNAEPMFQIASVTLFIEPLADVLRNTNVTLRCQARVITSGQEPLSREYTLYKDNNIVYNKATSSSEDFLYPLPKARVSNNGRYKCMIRIRGQEKTSKSEKLTVTGLSLPVLHINKSRITEGEDVTARCSAPGETGSFFFNFFDNSREIHEEHRNANQAEAKLRITDVGGHNIHCTYKVFIMSDSVKSNESNTVVVRVEGLSIKPDLEILPLENIYEGDNLTIKCSFRESEQNYRGINLILNQGTKLLGFGNGTTAIHHNMMAEATAPTLTFECRLTVENVVKVVTQTISVTELFSVPTLTMSPPQVFQMEPMTLICRSQNVASGRVNEEDLTYTLDPAEHFLTPRGTGVFSGKALKNEFIYTCIAQAKGIKKLSDPLTVSPKVPVSVPNIWAFEKAILGQSVRIFCQSATGSTPINYTFWKQTQQIGPLITKLSSEPAYISVTINDVTEINMYTCKSNNGGKEDQQSATLNTTVIEPVVSPVLIALPDPADVSEGNDLYLICSVQGTPPVTFRWYRYDESNPLKVTTSTKNHSNYHITALSKEQSGVYYCEAENRANVVKSELVNIEVRLALWKKALIGGVLLLVASLLIMVSCVLYYKHKRGKRETAAELSVKPASPKSDDSLTVNLTHDTEVYNAATVMVGRTVESVWSDRKPEADIDEEFSTVSNEPEVEYTEVVHPRSADPVRAPLKKGTETVYSELQNSPHGAADHYDYDSVKYAELKGEQPETSQHHTGISDYSDLPVPVD